MGLGVMGLADLLIKAEIPYDSKQGRRLASKCLKVIRWGAIKESMQLAKERGVFPLWEGSFWAKKGRRVRNAAMLTVAPTGTISNLVGVSSGIEPLFAIAYLRRTKEGQILRYIHPKFLEVAKNEGFYSEELMEKIVSSGGVNEIDEVPQKWRSIFKGAHDIHWQDHIAMQAELQKEVQNAISKTINLPNNASEDDVAQAYITAWMKNCKGITVFRDGSREEQVLTIGEVERKKSKPGELVRIVEGMNEEEKEEFFILLRDKIKGYTIGKFGKLRPKKVPSVLRAQKIEKETSMGELRVFITTLADGSPLEIDVIMGHSGSEISAACEAIGRLSSILLRLGADPWWVVKQLQGIGGPQPHGIGANKVLSLPDGIGRSLAEYLRRWEDETKNEYIPEDREEEEIYEGEIFNLDICPSCHNATLVHEDGCNHCINPGCFYSSC